LELPLRVLSGEVSRAGPVLRYLAASCRGRSLGISIIQCLLKLWAPCEGRARTVMLALRDEVERQRVRV
jgi:hypothetical protein